MINSFPPFPLGWQNSCTLLPWTELRCRVGHCGWICRAAKKTAADWIGNGSGRASNNARNYGAAVGHPDACRQCLANVPSHLPILSHFCAWTWCACARVHASGTDRSQLLCPDDNGAAVHAPSSGERGVNMDSRGHFFFLSSSLRRWREGGRGERFRLEPRSSLVFQRERGWIWKKIFFSLSLEWNWKLNFELGDVYDTF